MKQLTREQAIELGTSGAYKNLPIEERVGFQLFQDKLFYSPFSDFHGDLEEVLGYPIFTHQLPQDFIKGDFVKKYPTPLDETKLFSLLENKE
jgi:hypothetical protein